MTHNPRGYAFTSFERSYNRVQGWAWGAAMRTANIMPTKTEFIADGLYLWDRMSVGIDTNSEAEVRELVATIVKSLTGSLKASAGGRLDYRDAMKEGYRVKVKYDLADATYDFRTLTSRLGGKDSQYGNVPHVERGYELYEEHDAAVRLLQFLRDEVLTKRQWEVVATYLALEEPGNLEIAEAMGTTRSNVSWMWHKIREVVAHSGTAQAMR